MKALILSDNEYQTKKFQRLAQLVHSYLSQKNFDIENVHLEKDELDYCMGCFGCWTKKPGQCVINDKMDDINHSFINSDAVFYLSPIVYGQFSANMKNTLDRCLPNILPFFTTRKDGSTMHPPRYDKYPTQIMIGYGDDLTDDEKKLFYDINLKHRNNVCVMIYQDNDAEISEALNGVALERQGGEL